MPSQVFLGQFELSQGARIYPSNLLRGAALWGGAGGPVPGGTAEKAQDGNANWPEGQADAGTTVVPVLLLRVWFLCY